MKIETFRGNSYLKRATYCNKVKANAVQGLAWASACGLLLVWTSLFCGRLSETAMGRLHSQLLDVFQRGGLVLLTGDLHSSQRHTKISFKVTTPLLFAMAKSRLRVQRTPSNSLKIVTWLKRSSPASSIGLASPVWQSGHGFPTWNTFGSVPCPTQTYDSHCVCQTTGIVSNRKSRS